jgi:methyl-accepting chemotaxis protein
MKWFQNFKIGMKLTVGFGTVLVLMVVLGIVSLVEMSKLNGSTNDIVTNWLPSVRTLAQLKYDASDVRRKELNHILMTEKSGMDKYESQHQEILRKVQKDRNQYEPMISSDEERHIYDTFGPLWDKYLNIDK